jgi:hypothetical protein
MKKKPITRNQFVAYTKKEEEEEVSKIYIHAPF